MYPISHFICTYIELIYVAENNKKNINEYTIGRGKIGTWKGTGVNGWLYEISIPKKVSLQYTCQPSKAHIKPIAKIKNNDIHNQSIKLSIFSFLNLIFIHNTNKNQKIAQASEKL